MASRTVTLTVEGDADAIARAITGVADAMRAQTELAKKINARQYRVLTKALSDVIKKPPPDGSVVRY